MSVPDAQAAGEDEGGHRGADRRPRRRRVGRILGWTMVGLGAALLAWIAWLGFSGWRASVNLNAARTAEHAVQAGLQSGDGPAAEAAARDFQAAAGRARSWVGGPVWAVTAALPGSGPVRTVRTIARSAGRLGDVVPALLSARDSLQSAALRRADGGLDTGRLTELAGTLRDAATTVTAVAGDVAATPAHTWVGTVDAARSQLLTEVTALDAQVRPAADAADVVVALVAGNTPHRYFVAFQNEAEARGTGGLPGQFGILQISDGTPTFVHFGTDAELDGVSADVDLAPDYSRLYAAYRPTATYLNANVSPDFPTAARLWTALWTAHTGQRLDGAIALDPTALSYLLAVTGPAALPGGAAVGADDVVALTESEAYRRFGNDRGARQLYLAVVARAAVASIVGYRGSLRALVEPATRAAAEGRLLLWSADPALQARIAPTDVSGELPDTTAPFAGLTVVNEGNDKLDYYLDRSLRWTRASCADRTAVTAEIRLTNSAPAGLPASVTDRFDHPDPPSQPGDTRVQAFYFATAGAVIGRVQVDGHDVPVTRGTERGHPVAVVDVELPRGRTRTVTVALTEPASVAAPVVLRQPLVRPLQVQAAALSCP